MSLQITNLGDVPYNNWKQGPFWTGFYNLLFSGTYDGPYTFSPSDFGMDQVVGLYTVGLVICATTSCQVALNNSTTLRLVDIKTQSTLTSGITLSSFLPVGVGCYPLGYGSSV